MGRITYCSLDFCARGECFGGNINFDPSALYIPDQSYSLSFMINMPQGCSPTAETLVPGQYKLIFDIFTTSEEKSSNSQATAIIQVKAWMITLRIICYAFKKDWIILK